LYGGEWLKTLMGSGLLFGNAQNVVPQIVLIFLYNDGYIA
jgi:hypothetical protein